MVTYEEWIKKKKEVKIKSSMKAKNFFEEFILENLLLVSIFRTPKVFFSFIERWWSLDFQKDLILL